MTNYCINENERSQRLREFLRRYREELAKRPEVSDEEFMAETEVSDEEYAVGLTLTNIDFSSRRTDDPDNA